MTSSRVEPSTAGAPKGNPWLMLALGVLAQAAGTVLLSTAAFLIPLLHTERGLPLPLAGLLAATPTIGMVLTLILWGALADRVGERWVIAGGTALAALAAGAAAATSANYVVLGIFFVLGGAAAASSNAASGRLVVGWFPRERRGLAMGIRQMSQPLGVAIAAVTIPVLAERDGIAAAILASVLFCGVLAVACAIFLRDPARPLATSIPVPSSPAESIADPSNPATSIPPVVNPLALNPYRGSSLLWRIHSVSLLLVVPQFTLSTFGLVWLIADQHVTAALAGLVIGLSQFIGAIGRIGAGVLSDRVGSRTRPLRWVAIAAALVMLLLAGLDALDWPFAIVAMVLATTISVADNGLAFTAVAEIAGPRWSGRALGTQNTGQYIAASAVGPVAGALIGIVGYPLTFVASALCGLIAVPLVPTYNESADSHSAPAGGNPAPPSGGALAPALTNGAGPSGN